MAPSLHEHVSAFLARTTKPLLIITGPTGSGKTDLSLQMARAWDGEVVSADSRQLYRGMEIGANTVSGSEQQGVPHHLISFLEPDRVFTLAQYQQAAFNTIDDILARRRIPFLVGGTGLYVNAVSLNYAIPSVTPDTRLRNELKQRLVNEGFDVLRSELREQDHAAADALQHGRTHTLIRALEVARHGKTSVTTINTPRYHCLFIFVEVDAGCLRERVRQRVQRQWEQGMVRELQVLLEQGYGKGTHAMDAIYVREIMDFLEGKTSPVETQDIIVRNTIAYAKRQATWFRGLRKRLSPESCVTVRTEG